MDVICGGIVVYGGGDPGEDTPPGQTPHIPWQTPPSGQTPRADPLRSACWDTVNKQTVHILLECILVLFIHNLI